MRSQSSPFDWYRSHYWAVLSQIENDFKDFMIRDNLEIIDDNNKVFRDTKYGFHCNHDVKEDFETEYEIIHDKYIRRVEKFRKTIKCPTVFFRCVRDNEEIDYINNHWEYAEKLLKNFNEKNCIIYVLHSELKNITPKVRSYRLNINQYIGKTYEMRHMFDSSEELIDVCTHLISIEKMQKNLEFDNETNAQKAVSAYINKCVEENIDGIDKEILISLGASTDEEIYLWGAGKYGTALAKYLSQRNVKIKGIIDNKISDDMDKELNIIPFEKVDDGAKIFIAVAKKEANEEIVKQVMDRHRRTTIVRFQDLYEGDIITQNI